MQLIIAILILIWMLACIRVVPVNQVYIIEKAGVYKCVWKSGVHIKAFPSEKIVKKIYLGSQTNTRVFSHIATKDRKNISGDISIVSVINDPKVFYYCSKNPYETIFMILQESMKNIISKYSFEELRKQNTQIEQRIMENINIKIPKQCGAMITRVAIGEIRENG